MVEYAERVFHLSGHDPGVKQTRREVLTKVANVKKVPHGTLLKIPPLPTRVAYLWMWFCELRGERLTYSEIESWSRLTKKNLSILDVQTIMRLENLFQSSCQKPQV